MPDAAVPYCTAVKIWPSKLVVSSTVCFRGFGASYQHPMGLCENPTFYVESKMGFQKGYIFLVHPSQSKNKINEQTGAGREKERRRRERREEARKEMGQGILPIRATTARWGPRFKPRSMPRRPRPARRCRWSTTSPSPAG